MCITLFCTVLCRPCTTTTWNDQILTFFEDGKGNPINSVISVWTRAWPPLLSSNINSLLLSNWVTWDNREMVWKNAESIFQRRFYGSRRCRIVRSLVLLLKRQKFQIYLILSLNKDSYVIWCQFIQDWLFSALWSNKNMCPVNTDEDLSMASYQTLIKQLLNEAEQHQKFMKRSTSGSVKSVWMSLDRPTPRRSIRLLQTDRTSEDRLWDKLRSSHATN